MATPPASHPHTIEDLAQLTGISVRNLRSHRTNGLLQAPEVINRVGFYGAEHVARIKLIQRLQTEGFNLNSIRKLLDLSSEGPSEDVLGLMQTATQPFQSETEQTYTRDELVERFGAEDHERFIAEAVRLGMLVRDGDNLVAPSPSLLDAAEQVVASGVPLRHALAVIAKVQSRCEEIAHEFIRLFIDDVWKPFTEGGFPADGWAPIMESMNALRPISSQVVLRTYEMTMTREVEEATAQEVERLMRRG